MAERPLNYNVILSHFREEVAEATDARLDANDPLRGTDQLEATEASQKLVEEMAQRMVQGGDQGDQLDLESEVLTFQTNCPECNAPCTTNMKVTKVGPRSCSS